MANSGGTQAKPWLWINLIIIGLAVYAWRNPDQTHLVLERIRDYLPGSHPDAAVGSSTPEMSARPPAAAQVSPPPSDSPQAQAEAVVEAYMRKNASPNCTLSFLNWSDFSASGPDSFITLQYRVNQPGRSDIVAMIRCTVRGGTVAKMQALPAGGQSTAPVAAASAAVPVPMQTPRPVYVDHFSSALFSAENGGEMTMHLNQAYSLAQLEQAKRQAIAERKPLGFLMVWGQFFEQPADIRGRGSESALAHFYEVFHQHVVLVFVRHESELNLVPRAVKRGFNGPDEGGYAPNMAVTDATATEFIVEIPYRALDGAGRDPIFTAGAKQIDTWLATHPAAVTYQSPDATP